MEQGGDGGEFELAARDEQRELLGLGFVGTRHDGGANGVVSREHAVVQDGVCPRRWDESTVLARAVGRTSGAPGRLVDCPG